jgi:hypothetical protein
VKRTREIDSGTNAHDLKTFFVKSEPFKSIYRQSLGQCIDSLREFGYSITRLGLEQSAAFDSEWRHFKESWNKLEADRYLKAATTYRFRRYAAYDYFSLEGSLRQKPHQGFRQTTTEGMNNPYAGQERIFAPLTEDIANGQCLRILIKANIELFSRLLASPISHWTVGVHQIRVLGTSAAAGSPTPEGIHRDGYRFLASHLVNSSNLAGGASRIYDGGRKLIKEVAMRQPGDTVLLDDRRVYHEATPIYPLNSNLGKAKRDVIVISYDEV